MYSKCGSMVEARRVFDGLERNTHDAVSWTALMFGYVENKQELQALELFVSMAKVCRPNARAFVVALKACTRVAANEGGKVVAGDTIVKVRALENGMEIHRRAATDGFDKNTIVSNAVVEMYAQCGSLVDARAVLDRMVEHDEASWNALLLGYSQSGEQELALELFELLSSSGRSGGRPAYAAALKCCAELAAKEDGRTVDGKLVKLGSLGKVMRIHSQAVKIELDSDRFLASALVDTYAKCGSVLDARRVFDSMVLEGQDDLVLWTSIMLAHADNGEGRVTLELFSRIKSQPWWSPRDPQTMVAALKASGSSEVASLESARRIHAEACRHGLIERDEALASCLVDAYGRLGRSGDSQQVFDSIPVKDPLTWTALVAGYSRVGDPELVFRWFRKMVDEKIIPDAIACVCVLAACSHAGLVDRGREFVREMEAKFGIKPDIRHYSCVIDMLGRANRLEEGLAMAETMPVDPNAVTWTTLLGACAKWKNATLGKIAFERSRQTHPSNFQLMANIYA
ncbi:putative pentatricopeptide repeat-containing protein At5g09950 isoform X1 [Selaginella moellendorffii]|uniref:putative pentatricopeptide repeat-containing protein At5g09950 isoform X1 n=1 Tax=Selaginella moellendorffii TaxID=88036 RepID=UPI000D1C6E65|nr:putative pentatricopeptide repeat-containing protein At5g09950 isoform X1 [Selaginella moellendorffii]XP_024517892.1 putative pentatricopeptide repeat-containing protein At5g09950 isoform X1 [Selaginella moellendorffii]XP_024517894.1 putative pentatricopeptide repeat-containing protein At5g09950 isoform X1 [Selaginella moellendorffii]|eukprot:XP_024517891.1 putative pentatricopeptide repeat-containing protein At5g09950 isoform X1 [Selaginella moellendorffii]